MMPVLLKHLTRRIYNLVLSKKPMVESYFMWVMPPGKAIIT